MYEISFVISFIFFYVDYSVVTGSFWAKTTISVTAGVAKETSYLSTM